MGAWERTAPAWGHAGIVPERHSTLNLFSDRTLGSGIPPPALPANVSMRRVVVSS